MMKKVGGVIGLVLGIVDHQVHDPGDGDNACTLHADIQTETLDHRWAGSASAAWEAWFSPHAARFSGGFLANPARSGSTSRYSF